MHDFTDTRKIHISSITFITYQTGEFVFKVRLHEVSKKEFLRGKSLCGGARCAWARELSLNLFLWRYSQL